MNGNPMFSCTCLSFFIFTNFFLRAEGGGGWIGGLGSQFDQECVITHAKVNASLSLFNVLPYFSSLQRVWRSTEMTAVSTYGTFTTSLGTSWGTASDTVLVTVNPAARYTHHT